MTQNDNSRLKQTQPSSCNTGPPTTKVMCFPLSPVSKQLLDRGFSSQSTAGPWRLFSRALEYVVAVRYTTRSSLDISYTSYYVQRKLLLLIGDMYSIYTQIHTKNSCFHCYLRKIACQQADTEKIFIIQLLHVLHVHNINTVLFLYPQDF